MSEHVNVGAKNSDDNRILTKKDLIVALRSDPGSVSFDPTSRFGSQEVIKGNEIPDHVILSVCGPDPQNNRKWYASVKKSPKGVRVT